MHIKRRINNIQCLGLNLLLVLFPMCFSGQHYPHDVPEHDFIDYDYNFIEFFDDSSSFQLFYSKLDTLLFEGRNKLNIVHIGGSHIQADMWSDRVRQRLYNFIPNNNGGRGLLFPFRLAKTNNPYYYKVEYTGEWKGYRNSVLKHHSEFGVTGITAKTSDSLSGLKISFRGDNYPDYDFNTIKILHNQKNESYCIELLSDTNAIRITNDSIGYTEFRLSSYQETFEIAITKMDTIEKEFALYGVTLENQDPGICYHSIGVNGASVPSYLRCELFTKHLEIIKPDLVIFSVGINDAYDTQFTASNYEKNYDTLIKYFQTVSPNAALLFTTNNDSYFKRKYPNKKAEDVRDVMKNLAAKYGGGVWDMYGLMGGLGSVRTWEKAGLAKKDKIHFTKAGYETVGDLLFEAIIKSYNEFLDNNR
jgi:lysophospholipase L1-like esterase